MIVADSSEIKKYTGPGTVTALGSFDALHRGHTAIIRKAAELAAHGGYLLAVQFFRIPPGGFNADGTLECVNTPERRLAILNSLGVDLVIEEKFTDDFKNTDYRSFVTDYIQSRYNAMSVCAGYNYRFGRHAEGDADKLRSECESLGIGVYIQPCVTMNSEVSSSEIRRLIKDGRVDTAAEYMSRHYSMSGTVVRGRQVGRTYGFPTANINTPQGIVIPKPGVYKTEVFLNSKPYTAITNIGAKPTFSVSDINIETHIIGYDGDLYGKKLEIEFCRRLRDIHTFKSRDELKQQLEKDTRAALES